MYEKVTIRFFFGTIAMRNLFDYRCEIKINV